MLKKTAHFWKGAPLSLSLFLHFTLSLSNALGDVAYQVQRRKECVGPNVATPSRGEMIKRVIEPAQTYMVLSRSLSYRARQLLISYLLPKMNLEFEFSLSVGKTNRIEANLTLPEIRLGDKRAINLTKSNVNKPYDTFIIYFDVLPSNTPLPRSSYVHTIDLLIKPHARCIPILSLFRK